MKLSLITNSAEVARRGEAAGIDRLFIDLERQGKAERQQGRQLFLSDHTLADVPRIKDVLRQAELMVRLDPLHAGSRDQIAAVIDGGADLLMLPYFQHCAQAEEFVELVAGRAKVVLLVETREAADNLEELARLPGVAEVHIGLNDLSLSLGKTFLFELLADGTIDRLCAILRHCGLPFGFGGIGCLQRRDLPIPPELVLAEQVCQGSTRGWLGRTFREAESTALQQNVLLLRQAIARWQAVDETQIKELRLQLKAHIDSAKCA